MLASVTISSSKNPILISSATVEMDSCTFERNTGSVLSLTDEAVVTDRNSEYTSNIITD